MAARKSRPATASTGPEADLNRLVALIPPEDLLRLRRAPLRPADADAALAVLLLGERSKTAHPYPTGAPTMEELEISASETIEVDLDDPALGGHVVVARDPLEPPPESMVTIEVDLDDPALGGHVVVERDPLEPPPESVVTEELPSRTGRRSKKDQSLSGNVKKLFRK